MRFTPQQIQELLEIAERYNLTFIARTVGSSALTRREKGILQRAGFDLSKYPLHSIDKAFKFGILSNALQESVVKNMTYSQFKTYFKSGKHIALNRTENMLLQALKDQTASDLRKFGTKMQNDVRDTFVRLVNGEPIKHTKLVTDEVARAIRDRNSLKDVVTELGKKTGEWERDLGKIADTCLHHAFNEGRLAQIARDPNKKVYFDVYPGACKHCIGHYLTGGIGSEPKIFTVPELKANGSNVGKKVADWQPVIGGMHPFCRCTINEVPDGYMWNPTTRGFTTPIEQRDKEEQRKVKRKSKVRVTVDGVTTTV